MWQVLAMSLIRKLQQLYEKETRESRSETEEGRKKVNDHWNHDAISIVLSLFITVINRLKVISYYKCFLNISNLKIVLVLTRFCF